MVKFPQYTHSILAALIILFRQFYSVFLSIPLVIICWSSPVAFEFAFAGSLALSEGSDFVANVYVTPQIIRILVGILLVLSIIKTSAIKVGHYIIPATLILLIGLFNFNISSNSLKKAATQIIYILIYLLFACIKPLKHIPRIRQVVAMLIFYCISGWLYLVLHSDSYYNNYLTLDSYKGIVLFIPLVLFLLDYSFSYKLIGITLTTFYIFFSQSRTPVLAMIVIYSFFFFRLVFSGDVFLTLVRRYRIATSKFLVSR